MDANLSPDPGPAAANESKSAGVPSLPASFKATLIGWPLACALAAGAYVHFKVEDLHGEVEARPPLAIIDVNREVLKRIEANPAKGADSATREVYAVGAKLAESGYIVINSNSIVAFPEEYGVAP